MIGSGRFLYFRMVCVRESLNELISVGIVFTDVVKEASVDCSIVTFEVCLWVMSGVCLMLNSVHFISVLPEFSDNTGGLCPTMCSVSRMVCYDTLLGHQQSDTLSSVLLH